MSEASEQAIGKSQLPSPLVKEGRQGSPAVPTTAFLATVAFIPVWATAVLPLTLAWQVAKKILSPVLSQKTSLNLDSGYVVSESELTPREKRKYDVVVLGATGFTGGLAVRHLAKTYGVNGKVKWAIAGRSKSKLQKFKKEMAQELGMPDLETVDTILVDNLTPSTLPNLVNNTRCVATTAGPFTLYGNYVVEFCAKFGTHYVDITGELNWVRQMYMQWHKTAQKTGARLVPLCGNDSIPWDMMAHQMRKIMKDECQDDLVDIECWDESIGGAPGGTFATLMTVVDGTAISAPRVDVDPLQREPDGSKSSHKGKSNLPNFIAKSTSPWDDPSSSRRWTMPFVMAPVNAGVVNWSHALRNAGSPTLTYRESLLCPDFKTAFTQFFGLGMFAWLLFNPITKPLVQKYVLPQVGEGPSLDDMEHKHFLCVSAEGKGSNGSKVLAHMYFPKDPGCLETSRMIVEAGLSLALQESELPSKNGGFWTTSTGLGDVLMRRLQDTGTQFSYKVVTK